MALEEGELIRPPYREAMAELGNSDFDIGQTYDPIVDHTLSSSDAPRVAVLIPAYNEELTIGSVVIQARKHAHHVLVVNDGSKDRTFEIARAAGAEVINHLTNEGKAAALNTGFNELKKRDFDIVVMMDGDGQHDVEDIDTLISPIIEQNADLVIGSRFLKKGSSIPLYRQVGQRVLNRVTNMGSSTKVTDTQSGFRALSRDALDHIDFHSTGYAVEQNMIMHFSERNLKIRETPISVRYDVPNGHKRGSLSMGVGLLADVVAAVGYRRPLLMFGVPGLILCLAGLGIGMLTLIDSYPIGSWPFQTFLAGMLLILGTFLSVSALTLNSLTLLMQANSAK